MAKKKQKLDVIDGSKEEHKAFAGKNFSPHHLVSMKPMTYAQEQFMQSYYEDVPLIMQLGVPGSGKTMMALYCALNDVLDKGTVFEKVVIVRAATQVRDMGYAPGTSEEKCQLFEAPYVSLCDEIMTFKSNNYENLKAKGLIEFHSTSFLRGITMNNAIIIVDEVQSMSYHEASTICTRAGYNSKIIFCGDTKQNDLIKKKNDVSGLPKLIDVVGRMPSNMVDIITYLPNDIVRSGLVKEFILAQESLDE